MRDAVFSQLLQQQWGRGLLACVGLDPEMDTVRLAVADDDVEQALVRFNGEIVGATADLVCAYKPNIAFYERWGAPGISALRQTIAYINAVAPQVAVIVDAKRGDIASTNLAYRDAVFGYLGADAVTAQPYLGVDALRPFLDTRTKGVIVLCRTSNPGSSELQDLPTGGEALYQRVARLAGYDWNRHGNCGVLVGGTYPQHIADVRRIAPHLPILVAGVGRQGGSVGDVVRAGLFQGGGLIVSSSRAIIEAEPGPGFARAARAATNALVDQIRDAVTVPAQPTTAARPAAFDAGSPT
ncbi:orotidine-5'-phosphate decarboxylase [Micromonospora coerulea]|uniref:orotidine-5'-phosphate decarboxylase n=1 Tax=Micromonospora coerulea TaxID=47856 RepID=UPI0019075E20|nr:orotidine-5'-phosphate decarboxylase [Micromonospora veneta]